MKVHVMIATTKGVVAIQKITDLEDDDLQSFFSVRGTAQVLPISTDYHHLVKKGSGIIQSKFGGSSYRADISGEINHGNSWQLGVYVDHAVHNRHMLGDCEHIQLNDRIIIASGELNTSQNTVQIVTEIPKKLQMIQTFVENLPVMPDDIHVLLPEKNRADVTGDLPVNVDFVQCIDDLDEFLPALAASPDDTETSTNDSAAKVSKQEPSKTPTSLTWFGAGLITLLVAAGGFYYFNNGFMSQDSDVLGNIQTPLAPPDETMDPIADKPLNSGADGSQQESSQQESTQTDVAQIDTQSANDAHVKTNYPIVPTRMKALVSLTSALIDDFHPDCRGPSQVVNVALQQTRFADVPLVNLCALRIYTDTRIQQVFIIAPDSGYVAEVEGGKLVAKSKAFDVLLPKSRNVTRQYLLLLSTLKISTEQNIDLMQCIALQKGVTQLNTEMLLQCINPSTASMSLYQHALTVGS